MRDLRAFLVALVLALGSVTFISPADGIAVAAPPTTLLVSPGDPMPGETFTVSGRLPTGSAVVRPVKLQRRDAHRWRTIVSGHTAGDGSFTLATSTSAASVDLRVVARRIRSHHRNEARVVTPTATVTTVAQSGTIQVFQTRPEARTLTAEMTFTPARAGRPVTLRELHDDAWHDLGTGITDSNGNVTITAEPLPFEGEFAYQGVASAWNGAAAIGTDGYPYYSAPPLDAPHIDTSGQLPDGLAEHPYSVALTATGGTEPYTWAAEGLPSWLGLDADGTLSGTPPAGGGSWQFAVTVTGANGSADVSGFSLYVLPLVEITTTSLADGVVGERYDVTLTAVGGRQPYRWQSEGLPAGLNVEGRFGYIFGVPTEAGVFTVKVIIDDATGTTVTRTLTLTVG